MDYILIYNTPISATILREINEFNFKKFWEKNIERNNKNLIIGIAFLIFGCFIFIIEPKYIGTFLIGYSLACIGNYISYKSYFIKRKKIFNEILDKEIASLNRNSKDVLWEYTPEYFRFKNYKQDLKFSWECITYEVVEDKYLYITALQNINFILDKVNIDEINLKNTMEYLEKQAISKKD